MIRTQVYLPEEDVQTIAALAIERRVPKARIIRELMRDGIKSVGKKGVARKSAYKALKAISNMKLSGPVDLSLTMDDYLYGKKSKYA